jgi:hypothetical protein
VDLEAIRYRVSQIWCAWAQFYWCVLHADKVVFGIGLRRGVDIGKLDDASPTKGFYDCKTD